MHVKTLMVSPVEIEAEASLRRARELMAREGTPHLSVVSGGRIVGTVDDRDLRRVEPSTVPSLARFEVPWLLDGLRARDAMTRRVPAGTLAGRP
jgi:CBS domain-containing protein